MGLLDFLTKKGTISRYKTFSLTSLGKRRAEEFRNSPVDKVLAALEELGSATVDEIKEYSRLSTGIIERCLKIALRNGYVTCPVGEGEEYGSTGTPFIRRE